MTDLFFFRLRCFPPVVLKKNFILVAIPISSLYQPSLSLCWGRGVPDALPLPTCPGARTPGPWRRSSVGTSSSAYTRTASSPWVVGKDAFLHHREPIAINGDPISMLELNHSLPTLLFGRGNADSALLVSQLFASSKLFPPFKFPPENSMMLHFFDL